MITLANVITVSILMIDTIKWYSIKQAPSFYKQRNWVPFIFGSHYKTSWGFPGKIQDSKPPMGFSERVSLNERKQTLFLEGEELKKTERSRDGIFSTKKQYTWFTSGICTSCLQGALPHTRHQQDCPGCGHATRGRSSRHSEVADQSKQQVQTKTPDAEALKLRAF